MTSKTVLKYYPAKSLAQQYNIPFGTIVYAIKNGFLPDAKILIREKKPLYMLPKTVLLDWWRDVKCHIDNGDYIPVSAAALYLRVDHKTVHNFMNKKELAPVLILYSLKGQHINPFGVSRYYFTQESLDEIKNKRKNKADAFKNMVSSTKVAKMLKINNHTLLKRIKRGEVIPDKTVRVSKGVRGDYFTFYFHKNTVTKLLKNGIF